MLTKVEYRESVLYQLAGGIPVADLLGRYSPMLVDRVIGEAYDSLLANAYRQASSSKGISDLAMLDSYTKAFTNVSVSYDEDREEYYSELPAPIIILPDGIGVRLISWMKDQATQFIPITNNALGVFDELEVSKTSTLPTFYQEANKVWYNFQGQPLSAVLMKLVPSYFYLNDDDYVGDPQVVGKGGFLTVTDVVRQKLLTMPPEDTANDNIAK
jgi:hypothetical protein